MIVSAAESHLLSHLGWVDHGAVWLCDTKTAEVRQVAVGEARYLTLLPGREDLFAAVHHFDSSRLEITAHRITAPDAVLTRIRFAGDQATFEGDTGVWERLPGAFVAFYKPANEGEFFLFRITAHPRAVERQRLDWFDDSYDHVWQGITGVAEVPGSELLIVSVQRDSAPVLYDPRTRQALRKIPLAGRRGNPTLTFRRTAPELWADDYDVLLRLDPRDWSVRNTLRLQDTGQQHSRQFIGRYAFNHDESLCTVARPFSGDVIALNTHTFQVTHRAVLGRQPLDVALLTDGRVFARDWKAGDLLHGSLEPI